MSKSRNILAVLALVALVLTSARPARGQVTSDPGKIAGITIGLVVIGAGIGIGAYVAVHHNHRLTGCVASSPTGLTIINRGDQQTYALAGEISELKAGERVRVSGRKSKLGVGAPKRFLVERLDKDYGACEVQRTER